MTLIRLFCCLLVAVAVERSVLAQSAVESMSQTELIGVLSDPRSDTYD